MPCFLYAMNDSKGGAPFPIKKSEAKKLNEDGYGIFFSVNSFKTKQRVEPNLEKLLHWFVDIDTGSKKDQFEKIIQFEHVPTCIVETKRGHHVYWKMAGPCTITEYKAILERLVDFFGGDKNAKGTTRILRLPNFYHMKDPTKPYLIKEIFSCKNEYTVEQMNAALPAFESVRVLETSPSHQSISICSNTDDFWQKATSIGATEGLIRLSGAQELDGDVIDFSPTHEGKKHLIVNGIPTSACWIDIHDRIGSTDRGGPTIVEWINWYVHDKAIVAEILKKYFPELKQDLSMLENFAHRQ